MNKLLFGLSLAFMSASVFAHSPLTSSAPKDGAVLNVAPESLVLQFKRKTRITSTSVADSSGKSKKLTGSKEFSQIHKLPLGKMQTGKYLVQWRALSFDGHSMKGELVFTITP